MDERTDPGAVGARRGGAGAWVPVELRVGQPLVDLRTSSRRPVLLTNIASVLVGFAMYGNLLATTQQLQMPVVSGYGFGASVVEAGLYMVPGGLAMVAFAPVSARITRRYGARTTLLVGCAILALGYLGRVFLTDAIWQIVIGAAVVSTGTAIGYAAMPTLIMRSVPITETASANGLNTLLRAVGTSTSSAAVAAILAANTVQVGPSTLPSLEAFQDIFWVSAIAALAAVAVAVALPPRRAAATTVPAAPAAAVPDEEIKGRGRENEIVVRGVVVRDDLRPIQHAVVTVLTVEGEPVDWSRADNDGCYSVVLPGPGRYVVVSSAEGWAPKSDIVEFVDPTTQQHIHLVERLSLSGTITIAGRPLPHALVSVTRPSGEAVETAHADESGRYEMPLPPTGRYILTVVDPEATWARARQVPVIAAQSNRIALGVRPARGVAVVPILEIMGGPCGSPSSAPASAACRSASRCVSAAVAADVFEQAPELTEIGAAIALSANATRECARLGLLDELAAASTIPTELIYRDWRTGDRIAAHPVAKDDWYVERFGAPYFGIHRADLQKRSARRSGCRTCTSGCRLVNLVEQGDGVVLEFANGRVEHADLVVGADGVRSDGPPLGDRRRRRDLLGHQRLPRHRARREPAVPAGPARHPVLDGAGRAPAALRDRR